MTYQCCVEGAYTPNGENWDPCIYASDWKYTLIYYTKKVNLFIEYQNSLDMLYMKGAINETNTKNDT